MKQFLSGLLILLLASISFSDEVYKWVDENGKVHYGDKIPEAYKQQTEQLDVEINVVGQDESTRNKNDAYVYELERKEAQKKALERQAEYRRQRNVAKSKSRSRKPLTREQCRDRYVKRNAYRTDCFKAADEYYK